MTHFFYLENIARNDLWSFDFLQLPVTENGSFQSERLFQFVDDRSGLVFLDETNGSVEQEQGADDTEIDPVLKTCGEDGGGLLRSSLVYRVSLRLARVHYPCRVAPHA